MSTHTLRLFRDTCAAGAHASLPALIRVLYVLAGELVIQGGTGERRVAADAAWHGHETCTVRAGATGATMLRYELRRGTTSGGAAVPGLVTTPLLEHPIDLDEREPYLVRADRVDFALGGVALPHRHRGGGIRCLIAGALEVTVGDAPSRLVRPGEAWFESGREPVLAKASAEILTSFIRVAILPRAIRGQTSIVYVDPEDPRRAAPRKYTVYVDEPIEV
jgi:quercetin dioxygenase-like cupin family protein